MRCSITSLLWKEKGKRCNLRYYRPITVTSVLYKILGKSMVLAMRPVLPYLVSNSQAAFQEDPKYIGDATRLVQDVIDYCDSEHKDGFLLFCDQDNAYPRVEWDFLRTTLQTMGVHADFVRLVDTMHVGLEMKFKVNGHVGGHVEPSNALLQGDPCAPILYLLVIQTFISLLDTSRLQGIHIPGHLGDVRRPVQLRACGFADDLLVFMRHPSQLNEFRRLFDVYSNASGAVLSLSKSYGMRIGRLRHSRRDLPQGWVEGRDLQITQDAVRYLGIFLGAADKVRAVWDTRLTAKMRSRYAKWRERALPRTRGGRNIVVRNSVLSCGWYMVEGQFIDSLADVLEEWRRDAWRFFEGGAPGGSKGRTDVARAVLIQDYPEGGVRCQDVEAFVDSLYVRRVLRLADPAPHPLKGLVFYWVQQSYGHLRMGHRLFGSACDFLCLREDVPSFWRAALQAYGARQGLQPAVSQKGATPDVTYSQARAGMVRSVHVPRGWSLATILMEPLFYNPCMGGWVGARVLDDAAAEREDRRAKPSVTLMRSTPARLAAAREYYQLTVAFAHAGLTHVRDLVDERLQFRVWSMPAWTALPAVVRFAYAEVLAALPGEWVSVLRAAVQARAQQPAQTLAAFVAGSVRHAAESVWLGGPEGCVARVRPDGEVEGDWYVVGPLGRLRVAGPPRRPYAQWLSAAREMAVWEETALPHCSAEAEARDAQRMREGEGAEPPTFVAAGFIEDVQRLYPRGVPSLAVSQAATDLSHFAVQYGQTDRDRQSVGLHVSDAHHLYDLKVSYLFTPLRTFDLGSAVDPSDLTHTTWRDLLGAEANSGILVAARGAAGGEGGGDGDGGTPQRSREESRRGEIFAGQGMTGHDRVAKDLGYIACWLMRGPLGMGAVGRWGWRRICCATVATGWRVLLCLRPRVISFSNAPRRGSC